MVSPSVPSDKPAVKSRRYAPLLVGLLIAAVVAGGYLGWQHFAHNAGPAVAGDPPPVPVIAATVQKQNFPIVLTGIGNVAALNSATIRSMVTELIISVDFKDGQYIKKGELLAQLDPSTYQALLDQAEANLARDAAHLENGRLNLGRYEPLAKQGYATQQELATQQAKIAQEESVIKADQAAIEAADGDTLFELFTRTRAIRRGVVAIGQDSEAPDFGRPRPSLAPAPLPRPYASDA